MTLPQALLGFAAVALLLTLIPGLDTTLVLRAALARGRRHAALTAIGVCLGALAWGAAAALGATALLAASEVAYRIVAFAGALYMAVLGAQLILASFRAPKPAAPLVEARVQDGWWRPLATGATTNLLNPKVGVFYLATIPQFIPAGASPLGMGLLLAGIHAAMSLAWFALIIWGASAARRWLANARAMRIIDRAAGGVLIAFGAKLALEQRA